MTSSLPIDRRAFLKGVGGIVLALPVLDAMGAEVADEIPRRFCAIYTANGMSLPQAEHGIDEWSWFPRAENRWRIRLRQVDRAAEPVPQATQLHGRPLSSERPQGRPSCLLRHVAHRRPACITRSREPTTRSDSTRSSPCTPSSSLPAAFAGAFDRRRHRLPLADRHDFLQPRRTADPGGEQSAPRVRPAVPRRPLVAATEAQRDNAEAARSNWWTPSPQNAPSLHQQLGKSDRERMDQYLTSLDEVESRLIASERWIDVPLKKQDYSHLNLDATQRRRAPASTTATCST